MNIYPPAAPPTREVFFPTTEGTNAIGIIGFMPAVYCANGQVARTSFLVPYDFAAIVEAVLLVVPSATTAVGDFDLGVTFGSVGQQYNVHITGEAALTYNVVVGQLFEVPVAAILALIVAGDRGGVEFLVSSPGHDCWSVGLKLRYV